MDKGNKNCKARWIFAAVAAVAMLLAIPAAMRCIAFAQFSCAMTNKPVISNFDAVRDDYQLVADELMRFYAENAQNSEDKLDFVVCRNSETGQLYLGCFDCDKDALTDGAENSAFQRVYDSFDNDFSLEYVDVYSDGIYFIAVTGNFAVYYSPDGTRPDKHDDSFRAESIDQIIREDEHWYQLLIF